MARQRAALLQLFPTGALLPLFVSAAQLRVPACGEESAARDKSVASLLGFQGAGSSNSGSLNGTSWRVGKWLLLALLERVQRHFVAVGRVERDKQDTVVEKNMVASIRAA